MQYAVREINRYIWIHMIQEYKWEWRPTAPCWQYLKAFFFFALKLSALTRTSHTVATFFGTSCTNNKIVYWKFLSQRKLSQKSSASVHETGNAGLPSISIRKWKTSREIGSQQFEWGKMPSDKVPTPPAHPRGPKYVGYWKDIQYPASLVRFKSLLLPGRE